MKEEKEQNPSQMRGVKQYLRYNYWSLSPRPKRMASSKRGLLKALRERAPITLPFGAWLEAVMNIGRRRKSSSGRSRTRA
ncbi:MAG TPA: hypothetical protein PKK63_04275 [Bacillota bacterium]|nr:hypothetical protein [Bacillota bacterium]